MTSICGGEASASIAENTRPFLRAVRICSRRRGRLAFEWRVQNHPRGECPERRVVRRDSEKPPAAVSFRVVVHPTRSSVGVGAGNRDDPPLPCERVPSGKRHLRAIEQRRERFGWPEGIPRQRARKLRRTLIAPFAVGVEPFQGVEGRVPVVPSQRRLRGIGMCHDAEAPKAPHVFDDITRLAPQRERRLRKPDRDVVPPLRAQFDGVDDENPGSELRRVCPARTVAVIGQDDELQSCAGRGGRNLVWRAGAVGTIRVNVKRAGCDWRCGG